ncbi:MAG: hypothetical protein ACE5Z5_09760 [Candidatus Bathyarchaeia archaeon]
MREIDEFKKGTGETLHEMYQKYHPQIPTTFEKEVEKYWGKRWKANTTVGKLRMVLLHRPGREMLSVGSPTPWPPHGSGLGHWRMSFKPDLDEMIEHHEDWLKAEMDWRFIVPPDELTWTDARGLKWGPDTGVVLEPMKILVPTGNSKARKWLESIGVEVVEADCSSLVLSPRA